jgi:HD-GYP domain-containing protein (c-di-GMP phosphodiesterase class II)
MRRVSVGFSRSSLDAALAAWTHLSAYVPVAVVGILASTALFLVWAPTLTPQQAAAALALTALMAVSHLFPLQFTNKTSITLDASVLFAAVLLFDPLVAMLIAGGGCLVVQAVRRDLSPEGWFNTGKAVLQAGVGGAILALGGWDPAAMHLNRAGELFYVCSAAAGIYLVNLASVAGHAALRNKLSARQALRQFVAFSSVEDFAQFTLGLLAAIVASIHAWAFLLVVLPGVVVYHSLQRQITIRRQTIEAVESLADIIDLRDPYTANHSRRVAAHARTLATLLNLETAEIDLIERAARVHDIGKIALDRDVLEKVGSLDDADWAQVRSHPGIGATILGRFPEFALATEYVRFHHERVDGQGYPDSIPGEYIPLGARIIAVADALDAMTIDRPYRPGVPVEAALAEFRRRRGTQWDTEVVDALLAGVESGQIALPGFSSAYEPSEGLGGLAFAQGLAV